jgi:hypothetical protein
MTYTLEIAMNNGRDLTMHINKSGCNPSKLEQVCQTMRKRERTFETYNAYAICLGAFEDILNGVATGDPRGNHGW